MRKKLVLISAVVATLGLGVFAGATDQVLEKVKGAVESKVRALAEESNERGKTRIHSLRIRAEKEVRTESNVQRDQVQQAAGVTLPPMIGMVISGDDWGSASENIGVYKLPTNSDDNFEYKFHTDCNVAGVLVGDTYYGCRYSTFFNVVAGTWYSYNINTGAKLPYFRFKEGQYCSISATYDPTTATVYGLNYNNDVDSYALVTMMFDEGKVTVNQIAEIEGDWCALACDGYGRLYGISFDGHQDDYGNFIIDNSTLNRFNKYTGEFTRIGDTGVKPAYITDASFDTNTNKLYWAIGNETGNGYMAEVNTTTGVATKVLNYPNNEEVTGLVVRSATLPGTPKAATNLAAAYPNGALSGTISFTAPTTDTEGNALSGNITYRIIANGQQIFSDACAPGENISQDITMPADAHYRFAVVMANGAKNSDAAVLETYIGYGTPERPVVTASWAENKMTISWEKPTTTLDGGYMEPDASLTYTVKDVNSGDVIATLTNETSYSFSMSEPPAMSTCQYTVTVTYRGKSSTGLSNVVAFGAQEPPYFNGFDTDQSLAGFTIIDANEDGKKFEWNKENQAARLLFNSEVDMDDWLISPGIIMEAGKIYTVSVDARAYSDYWSEKFSLHAGDANTVEGMTTELVPTTELGGTLTTYTAYYIPETSGLHYIGVHGESQKNTFYLFIDNLSVSAGMSAGAPGEVTDLKVTPDAGGALRANLSFKTPLVNYIGEELESMSGVEVYVDGLISKKIEETGMGAPMSIDVNVPIPGNHEFVITTFNGDGKGKSVTGKAYIGYDVPKKPENFIVKETSPLMVSMNWSPVTTDLNGLTITPAELTYSVYMNEGTNRSLLASGLTNPGLDFDLSQINHSNQFFAEFVVTACNLEGESAQTSSGMMPVGAASEGFKESFPNGNMTSQLISQTVSGNGKWVMMTDASGVAAQDGDNGFTAMKGETVDESATLTSGKIDLKGISNPALSLYSYTLLNNGVPSTNEIKVEVSEVGSGVYTTLLDTTVGEINGEEGWHRVLLNLSQYSGKTIVFRMYAKTKMFQYTLIDNIRIVPLIDHDLKISKIKVPHEVTAGSEYTVTVEISNEGMNKAEGHTVELYLDGAMAATTECDALESGQTANASFTVTMHPLAQERVKHSVVLNYSKDMISDNNESEEAYVTPTESKLPAVTDLKLQSGDGEDAVLVWSEPNLNVQMNETVNDDIESYEAWSKSIEGWTFVDVDNSPVGGFQGITIPGLAIDSDVASFFVFNREEINGNASFAMHSGNQCLASMFRYDDGIVNDWAISPELSGERQTISFWARSYSSQYPEKFEVWYSTGSLNPNDFVKIATRSECPNTWEQYSYELPAGAKHFAIRSCAAGAYMLMIDDITYEGVGDASGISLSGYNVWRNGKAANSEILEETTFTDHQMVEGDNVYVVTAQYEKGHSKPSNSVKVNVSGLNELMNAGIRVCTAAGKIIVTGVEGTPVEVFSSNGSTVFNNLGEATTTIYVAPGVYMVTVANKTIKVIVK